ncbi:MAG: 16S rRNA (uracil(1498)-N(3))-methyltransferase [Rickettsiella sp.]|nr:16S rRNA (uracil(1498)-N(3))-methyltransferase [Rickettsiella sp.]
MRLTRIYQQQPLNEGSEINLSQEAVHHLTRVLRLTVGSEFVVFNGEGGEFKAKIIAMQKKIVTARVGAFNPMNPESPLQIILGQAIIRSEKMDYTLQKAVELGITHFMPLITERSWKLPYDRLEKRLSHWQAVIVNACEQSGRTQIPSLEEPILFQDAINKIQATIRAILIPNLTQTQLPIIKTCHRVAILVGPEGGWSKIETILALDAGYIPVQLGPRILRAETAGLVATTVFQGLFGDISLNLV